MRILFLASEFPYPPVGGGRLRVYHLLKALCRCHEVSLITFAKPHEAEHLEEVESLGVRSIYLIDGLVRIRESGINQLFEGLPQFVRTYSAASARDLVAQVLTDNEFDVVHVEEIVMATNLLSVDSEVPRIVAHQKIDVTFHWRVFSSERFELWRRTRMLAFLECIKLLFHERQLLRRIRSHVVLAESDRRFLRKLSRRASISVVANGVDTQYFAYSDPRPLEVNRIVFHGSMDYAPNVDAALYFMSDIYPKIIASMGPTELVFVGRNPSAKIVELSNLDRVIVTGTIPDIRPFLESAAVVIVPMRIGGGIRNKILEAMAIGRPVVSTSVGAEGIRYTDGKDILIADTPSDFSARVVKVLSDIQLAKSLALQGRELVENEYGWASIAQNMSAVYSKAIALQSHSTEPSPNQGR